MNQSDSILLKQLAIFMAILAVSLGLTYLAHLYSDEIKAFAQNAAVAANESGKAFSEIMTEDLDPE